MVISEIEGINFKISLVDIGANINIVIKILFDQNNVWE